MQTPQPDRRLPGLVSTLHNSGIKQADLAERSGLSPQYVSDILNGRRSGWASRKALADALGVTVADLITEQAS